MKSMLCVVLVSALACACSREPNAAAPAPSGQPGSPAVEQPIAVGGGCQYEKLPGTCTVQEGSKVTFEGKVDDKVVKLADNPLDPNSSLKPGSSSPCTLDFATAGTCTPCLISLGGCGSAAWDLFRNRKGSKP